MSELRHNCHQRERHLENPSPSTLLQPVGCHYGPGQQGSFAYHLKPWTLHHLSVSCACPSLRPHIYSASQDLLLEAPAGGIVWGLPETRVPYSHTCSRLITGQSWRRTGQHWPLFAAETNDHEHSSFTVAPESQARTRVQYVAPSTPCGLRFPC